MQQFNSKNLKIVREQLNAVLEVAADQLGITLTTGNISYTGDTFNIKITGVAPDSSGNLMSPIELAYNKLKTDDMLNIGDTFESQGKIFTLVGWKIRSRKYPIVGINEKGAKYKFTKKFAYKLGKAPKWMK